MVRNELRVFDLGCYVLVYWRHFLAWVVGITALAVAAAFLIKPVYEAKTVVMSRTLGADDGNGLGGVLGGFASLTGAATATSGQKYQALAILRSRAFTEEFIVAENLLPVIFADDWDDGAQAWKTSSPPTLYDAFIRFDKDIRIVSEDFTSGTVTLIVHWYDPNLAAKWANQLIERLNAKTRSRAINEARESLEYLRQELEKTTTVALQQAISRLVEKQIQTITLADVHADYSFTVIDPAAPADMDGYYLPNRPLLIGIGLLLGAVAGFLACILQGIGAFGRGSRDETTPHDS